MGAIDRSWTLNIDSDPEACGFELLGSFDRSSGHYEFDAILVLRDKETNLVYIVEDSGCSCPTPFGGVTNLSHLTLIDSIERLGESLHSWRKGHFSESTYCKAEEIDGWLDKNTTYLLEFLREQ